MNPHGCPGTLHSQLLTLPFAAVAVLLRGKHTLGRKHLPTYLKSLDPPHSPSSPPYLQAQFLTLPFAAVAALLRSDRVVTDSENSVLVLASLWVCRSPMAQYCTAEQLRYIAGCIR